MSLSSFFSSGYHRLVSQLHTLRYTGMWTVVLILVAGVASIVPELAFLHSSQKCGVEGYVKIPMELPGMRVCLPAQMVKESPLDVLVPALFASLAVACSAYVLSNIGFM